MSLALKHGTIMYVREVANKKEGKDGMSASAVCALVKNATGINLCPRTLQKKVKAGAIGV